MSGIAGIIHFDGAPVAPRLVEKMTSAMAYRGPDGINHWIKGPVALGQCILRNRSDAEAEHQPRFDLCSGTVKCARRPARATRTPITPASCLAPGTLGQRGHSMALRSLDSILPWPTRSNFGHNQAATRQRPDGLRRSLESSFSPP